MRRNLSIRETVLAVILLVLIAGAAYYMGFCRPLQAELTAISYESLQLDAQIASAASKAAAMDAMQLELDEILSRPAEEITEVAPYDNKEAVLQQLNGILQQSEEYSLHFSEPSIEENGTVRRNVVMQFTCTDFASAKAIIQSLTDCRWRCLISNLSISGTGDVMDGPVEVNATVTFFESTNVS